MSTGAKLTSVESLAALKSAVAAFVDDAKTALGAVEMETRRVQDWLGREMPAYWQRQLQKWREEIAVAKAALARKRLQRTEHYIPDTSEEEKMLAYAKFKCEEAEEKLEKIKKWSRQIERNWDEYQGIAGQLADIVVGNPPKCVADLNRLLSAVEAYLRVAASSGLDAMETEAFARPEDDIPKNEHAPSPAEKIEEKKERKDPAAG